MMIRQTNTIHCVGAGMLITIQIGYTFVGVQRPVWLNRTRGTALLSIELFSPIPTKQGYKREGFRVFSPYLRRKLNKTHYKPKQPAQGEGDESTT